MGNWGFWLAAIIRHVSSIGCIAIFMWQIFGFPPSIINDLHIAVSGNFAVDTSLLKDFILAIHNCTLQELWRRILVLIFFLKPYQIFVSDEISIN